MDYEILQIQAPGFVGSQAKKALVKITARHGTPFSLDVLHFGKNGYPIHDQDPPLRFDGNGRSIRLIGLGSEGRELVFKAGRSAMPALARELGYTPPYRYNSGVLLANKRRSPIPYEIRCYASAMSRDAVPLMRDHDLGNPVLRTEVARRLNQAIARQLKWIAPFVHAPTVNADALEILETTPVEMHGQWRTQLHLRFSMPLGLVGPWQFGSLQSRGYGFIRSIAAASSLMDAA